MAYVRSKGQITRGRRTNCYSMFKLSCKLCTTKLSVQVLLAIKELEGLDKHSIRASVKPLNNLTYMDGGGDSVNMCRSKMQHRSFTAELFWFNDKSGENNDWVRFECR